MATDTTCETSCQRYARWLAELEQVEQDLVAGAQAVDVQSGPKKIAYTAAQLPEVRRRIYALRVKVAACNGTRYNARRILEVTPHDSGSRRRWP